MTLFVRLPLAGGLCLRDDRVKSTEGFIRELSTGMGHVSSHPEEQNSFTSRSQALGVMIRTVIRTTGVRTYPKTLCKFNALDRPRPTRPIHACYRLALGQGLRRAQIEPKSSLQRRRVKTFPRPKIFPARDGYYPSSSSSSSSEPHAVCSFPAVISPSVLK